MMWKVVSGRYEDFHGVSLFGEIGDRNHAFNFACIYEHPEVCTLIPVVCVTLRTMKRRETNE